MGNEALCQVVFDGETGEAKALLETDELIVRSPFRVKVAFAEVQHVECDDDELRLRWANHQLRLKIGADAKKWAEKIRNPKSVIEKLGVKAGQKISIVGDLDERFVEDLKKAGADVSGQLRKSSDVIFFAADAKAGLQRLNSLKNSIVTNGSIWVIRPKGTKAIAESDVMAAGKAAGLVDTKVVRFSATHTAEKLVIPITKR